MLSKKAGKSGSNIGRINEISRQSKKIRKGIQKKQEESMICHQHNSQIEFLCTNDSCLQELCGHCILKHAHHIQQIMGIKQILKKYLKGKQVTAVDPLLIIQRKNESEKRLQDVELQLKRVVEGELQKYRNQLIEIAIKEEEAVRACEGMKLLEDSNITHKCILLLQRYLKYHNTPTSNQIKVEEELLVEGLKECLAQNIAISKESCLLESFNDNCPKLLHWFE